MTFQTSQGLDSRHSITIIGIGDDGCASLSSKAINALSKVQILAGSERHLAFFPDFSGEKVVWKGSLSKELDRVQDLSLENQVAILASGDPLFFGIAPLVIRRVGRENVEVIPHLSALQLACSRIGLAWNDASWISLHGRSRVGFLTKIKRMRKLICYTDPVSHPAAIAQWIEDSRDSSWKGWLCENLYGVGEKIRFFEDIRRVTELKDFSELNVLVMERKESSWKPPPIIQNFHEDLYAKKMPQKGLITKKEVRLLSVSELQVRRKSIVWDIGSASGSIAIECALQADHGRVYAVEVDSECIGFLKENISRFAVDNVEVMEGVAPDILSQIEKDPDCVFIGGSKGRLNEIIQNCWTRLHPGGRLVVNAITMENIHEVYHIFRKVLNLIPEVLLVQISRGVPLARYLRYEAQNPIHIFYATKPNV